MTEIIHQWADTRPSLDNTLEAIATRWRRLRHAGGDCDTLEAISDLLGTPMF